MGKGKPIPTLSIDHDRGHLWCSSSAAPVSILRWKWDMVGWMIFNILPIPAFSFLPLYWRMDDFSRGQLCGLGRRSSSMYMLHWSVAAIGPFYTPQVSDDYGLAKMPKNPGTRYLWWDQKLELRKWRGWIWSLRYVFISHFENHFKNGLCLKSLCHSNNHINVICSWVKPDAILATYTSSNKYHKIAASAILTDVNYASQEGKESTGRVVGWKFKYWWSIIFFFLMHAVRIAFFQPSNPSWSVIALILFNSLTTWIRD